MGLESEKKNLEEGSRFFIYFFAWSHLMFFRSVSGNKMKSQNEMQNDRLQASRKSHPFILSEESVYASALDCHWAGVSHVCSPALLFRISLWYFILALSLGMLYMKYLDMRGYNRIRRRRINVTRCCGNVHFISPPVVLLRSTKFLAKSFLLKSIQKSAVTFY